jgi:hypothetical protein
VADPERKKLGTHTSNWSEFRPKEEMLEDFADMDDASLALLKVFLSSDSRDGQTTDKFK